MTLIGWDAPEALPVLDPLPVCRDCSEPFDPALEPVAPDTDHPVFAVTWCAACRARWRRALENFVGG